MKKIRRVLGIMMCMVLAFGCLTGCAGKKSDVEILTGAVKKINEAKNSDITMKMSGKMSMDMGELGGKQDVDMSTEMKATQFSDPVKMKATTSVTSAGVSTTVDCYMQEVDGDFVVYAKPDSEDWTKSTLTDYKAAVQSAGVSMVENFSSDTGKYTKKEDKTEGDKTYLVYDYTISGEEIKELMGGMTSSFDSLLASGGEEEKELVEKMMNNMIDSIGSITLTLWIDQEEETIYRVDYPMTDLMNNMLNAVVETLKSSASEEEDADAEELSQIFSQIKMSVSDMNAVITYSNINSAADFEIPQEALDAEEASETDDLDADADKEE